MYSILFLLSRKWPLHPSLFLLAFINSQFCPVQSNSCLMNGEFMPEVWRAQLTNKLTETAAVCLFALGLKPAKHLQTHTSLISLGAWYLYGHGTCIGTRTILQVQPQGGELSPMINISTTIFQRKSIQHQKEHWVQGIERWLSHLKFCLYCVKVTECFTSMDSDFKQMTIPINFHIT